MAQKSQKFESIRKDTIFPKITFELAKVLYFCSLECATSPRYTITKIKKISLGRFFKIFLIVYSRIGAALPLAPLRARPKIKPLGPVEFLVGCSGRNASYNYKSDLDNTGFQIVLICSVSVLASKISKAEFIISS